MFRSLLLLFNGFMLAFALLTGIYHLGEWLYDNPPPVRPAYNISGRELPPRQPVQDMAQEMLALSAEPVMLDLSDGSFDAKRVARLFSQCAACHDASEQGTARVGPNLWNVVNRPVASLTNYRYSRALQEWGQDGAIWDEERLDIYLGAPSQTVPGTTMAFRGLRNTDARRAMIAFLRSLMPQENEYGKNGLEGNEQDGTQIKDDAPAGSGQIEGLLP